VENRPEKAPRNPSGRGDSSRKRGRMMPIQSDVFKHADTKKIAENKGTT
jgi:hypothetical protein